MSAADVAALRAEYAAACARQRWGEAAAVAVLLGFGPVAGHQGFSRHVSAAGADWDEILAGPWSSGERFLIETAAALWRGWGTADISRVAFIDDTFFTAWLAMITAARSGRLPQGW
jgi:hypothetical protein